MMYKDNTTQAPVYYYPTTDPKRWMIKVFDLLLQNSDGSTFTSLDPESEGVHYANARVDTFYKAILIPTDLFSKFVTFVDTQFNKTEGPAKGMIMCEDAANYGFCYVNNMTCA